MLFAVYARDLPGKEALRRDTLRAHRAHLDLGSEGVKLHASGPLLDGDAPCGSLFLYEAETPAAVRALVARDPNLTAGIYASIEITRFDWRRGAPE